MILSGGRFAVFVATRPVDFRKGMDGLAAVVQQQLRLDPFCGAVVRVPPEVDGKLLAKVLRAVKALA